MLSRVLATLVLILVLAAPPIAQGADVAVVLSDTSGAYSEFSTTFQQFSEGSNWRVRWTGRVENLEAAPRTDLIVTVGSEATRAVLQRGGNTPVVATLLPRPAYERAVADAGTNRPKGGSTAIFLDQPVSRLLSFTRYLLPDRHRIGILAGSETRAALPQIRQAANAAGLGLEVEEMDNNANPVPAANHLLPRSDVLLALPDSGVYRRDNIRAILLTSYRFQRPVIGFSQSLVTSGALAAIFSTPTQIARQTMDLVKSLRPEAITLPAPQPPTLFAIAINQNVAQALGLALPDEPAIRRALAADKDAR
jgi:putative ABC transport system substrate-binding protein